MLFLWTVKLVVWILGFIFWCDTGNTRLKDLKLNFSPKINISKITSTICIAYNSVILPNDSFFHWILKHMNNYKIIS